MARFESSGIDDLIDDLKQLHELTGEMADEMLRAGGKRLVGQWRYSAYKHGHVDTKKMVESIAYSEPFLRDGMLVTEVYPRGSSRKVKNETKAFVTNCGTSKLAGTHWVDEAESLAENKVNIAMTEVYERHLKERNL